MALKAFLSRERTVASDGFDRWMVPPAALAVHLCIGMIYAMSVFWLPLSHAGSGACPEAIDFARRLVDGCDWRVSDLVVGFEISIVFLGCSAATAGSRMDRAGPRVAGLLASLLWPGGLAVAALGVHLHLLWLVCLGMGVLGGMGLGLGYVSPVSMLVSWFPDRRGMATGMAIMGFGGGAMVGAPLATWSMEHMPGSRADAVCLTLLALAAVHAVVMACGSLGYRVPPPGWSPPGHVSRPESASTDSMLPGAAIRTRRFVLLWIVLATNVMAGIGLLSMASPMLQQTFGVSASVASGFVGLLSVFNIAGRFAWSSLSDGIGRKTTYAVLLGAGAILYATVPWAAANGGMPAFVGSCCLLLSMYGGGFATIPAYLSDLFGSRYVGILHGRLLTAWAVAGVLGPMTVVGIADRVRHAGGTDIDVDRTTFLAMSGIVAVGFVADLLVRTGPRVPTPARSREFGADSSAAGIARTRPSAMVMGAWACVVVPMVLGFAMVASKISLMF